MALKLRNRWHHKGDDWWAWEAFLDDDGSGDLAKVKYVEYILHPTFTPPVQKVTDPMGGYALKTEGWGTFELKAFVHLKDGTKQKLKHDIVLEQQPSEGVSPG